MIARLRHVIKRLCCESSTRSEIIASGVRERKKLRGNAIGNLCRTVHQAHSTISREGRKLSGTEKFSIEATVTTGERNIIILRKFVLRVGTFATKKKPISLIPMS